jgi:hypothetical protein
MKTQISSKLAAFAVALVMNTVIMGGIAQLFSTELQAHTLAGPHSGSSVLWARVAA